MYSSVIIITIVLVLFPSQMETVSNRSLLINYINQNQTTWTAGENFAESLSTEALKLLNGALGFHPNSSFKIEVKHHKINRNDIPETFDAREKWPQCSDVIGKIRNQGQCGSCWAFASAEVMSDRLCIATDGAIKFHFSPEDLVECCSDCVPEGYDKCTGGFTGAAYQFWITEGVVSGGDYSDNTGCKPYLNTTYLLGKSPSCQKKCQSKSDKNYEDDKKFGSQTYKLSDEIEQIQTDIMANGPVTASYEVYEDFYFYKSGVYQHITGPPMGRHAVKIIGWGTENNAPYWLIANSWGTNWGNLKGFFKILRGQNHCKIEEMILAGNSKKSDSIVHRSTSVIILLGVLIHYVLLNL